MVYLSARNEVAQPACLNAGPLLKLSIAEGLLRPHLGGDHITLLQIEPLSPCHFQELGQIERPIAAVKTTIEIGTLPGQGKEGIELLKAHDINRILDDVRRPALACASV